MIEALLLISLWCSVPANTVQNVDSCRERLFTCVEAADRADDRQLEFVNCFKQTKAGDANEVALPQEVTGEEI